MNQFPMIQHIASQNYIPGKLSMSRHIPKHKQSPNKSSYLIISSHISQTNCINILIWQLLCKRLFSWEQSLFTFVTYTNFIRQNLYSHGLHSFNKYYFPSSCEKYFHFTISAPIHQWRHDRWRDYWVICSLPDTGS